MRTALTTMKGLILAGTAAALLAGCGSNGGEGAGGGAASPNSSTGEGSKLQVVATFYPMYEFSRQVGGELADVTGLIPAGAEPHDWEPSAKDMALISEADVFVYNGLVETWADKALASAANDKRVAVQASEGITLQEGVAEEEEEDGHDHGTAAEGTSDEEGGKVLDPHVWLDPVLAQKEVANIAAAFAKADPAHQDKYKANADAYIAKLQMLDQAYRDGLKTVKRHDFVTQHAAFGYLAKEYGLVQIPIAGLSPEQEPSPEQMAGVVQQAKERDIQTIFFETLVDPKIAETIAKEIGAKTDVLNPIEGLTEDDKQQGLDYIGIMENNLAALQKALNE
ncbi:metal ABC transporter substrate-binding protein [Cohnella lubricantis]|uniref:Zinc ABC transporter substrate-binding protein n=1 Tax=Cohnella lubricantis TaxID=2163172 RepID=A0A841TDS4_9BACL|nr:metal ABC transporter substrate-binding protein [Cohnella lubricantis]MBB6678376.1 zinc ABC transporter substrate-binding protein [Cohnella lubricantis]MBP2116756.1 zinc transport system substrate-binding protein [Cohnella lubricantis]